MIGIRTKHAVIAARLGKHLLKVRFAERRAIDLGHVLQRQWRLALVTLEARLVVRVCEVRVKNQDDAQNVTISTSFHKASQVTCVASKPQCIAMQTATPTARADDDVQLWDQNTRFQRRTAIDRDRLKRVRLLGADLAVDSGHFHVDLLCIYVALHSVAVSSMPTQNLRACQSMQYIQYYCTT